jgi:hypothetical protein
MLRVSRSGQKGILKQAVLLLSRRVRVQLDACPSLTGSKDANRVLKPPPQFWSRLRDLPICQTLFCDVCVYAVSPDKVVILCSACRILARGTYVAGLSTGHRTEVPFNNNEGFRILKLYLSVWL